MAENNTKVIVDLEVTGTEQITENLNEAASALENIESKASDASTAVAKVGDSAKGAGAKTKDAGKTGESAMVLLDEATGGLASRFKAMGSAALSLGKGLKGSFQAGVKGSKALKTALISTGIGALVVAVGLLVAYWDEIEGFITGASNELANQQAQLEQQLTLSSSTQTVLENQLKVAELRGESTDQIILNIRKEIVLQQGLNAELLKNLQIQLETEQKSRRQVGYWDQIKYSAVSLFDPLSANLMLVEKLTNQTEEELELIKQVNQAKIDGSSLNVKIATLDAEGEKKKRESFQATNKASDAAGAKRDAAAEKRKTQEEAFAKQLLNIREANIKSTEEKALREIEIERDKQREILKANKATTEELKAFDDATLEQIDAVVAATDAQQLEILNIKRAAEAAALVDKKASKELIEAFDKETAFLREELAKDSEIARIARADAQKGIQDAEIQTLKDNKKKIDDIISGFGDTEVAEAKDLITQEQVAAAYAELELAETVALEKVTLAGATAEEIYQIELLYAEKKKELDANAKASFDDQREEQLDALKENGKEALNDLVAFAQASQKAEEDKLQNALDNTEKGTQAYADAEKALDKQKQKAFKRNQAEAIGRTIIDTAQGAQKAYVSQLLPGDPTSPIRGALAAAAVGVSGALKIATIKKQKYYSPAGTEVTVGSPSVPSGPAYDPNAALASNASGQQGENQITLGNQTASTGANVIKAYVVSSDMSSQQAADKAINDLARL